MIWSTIWQKTIAYGQQLSTSLGNSFYFNGFDISNCGTIGLKASNHDDIEAEINTYQTPLWDWWGVLTWFVPNKPIGISVAVKADSEEELNDIIDLMKRKLIKREWTLKIKVNGEFRQCKASLTSIKFNRDYEIKEALANVNISFMSMEMLTSETPVAISEIWVTVNDIPFDVTNEWGRRNYAMYIVFWTVTDTDFVSITHKWFVLSVSEDITSNSILIIDWTTGKVTLNWDDNIDYDWPIMPLDEWSNSILVHINWTFTADITILYNTNYW